MNEAHTAGYGADDAARHVAVAESQVQWLEAEVERLREAIREHRTVSLTLNGEGWRCDKAHGCRVDRRLWGHIDRTRGASDGR